MIQKISLLSVLFAATMASCGAPPAPASDTSAAPTITSPQPTMSAATPADKLPEGKWVSADDKSSIFVIKGDMVYDYYGQEKLDSSKYTISTSSCDANKESANKEPHFLVWHEDMCYEILTKTEDRLELIYRARGNTLTYNREK